MAPKKVRPQAPRFDEEERSQDAAGPPEVDRSASARPPGVASAEPSLQEILASGLWRERRRGMLSHLSPEERQTVYRRRAQESRTQLLRAARAARLPPQGGGPAAAREAQAPETAPISSGLEAPPADAPRGQRKSAAVSEAQPPDLVALFEGMATRLVDRLDEGRRIAEKERAKRKKLKAELRETARVLLGPADPASDDEDRREDPRAYSPPPAACTAPARASPGGPAASAARPNRFAGLFL